MAHKFTKEYWDKETYGWYAVPFLYYTPKNNVDKSHLDQTSLRYCESCDNVYEAFWMGGKYKYYKIFIYDHFPKYGKKLTCPKCKGKKVKECIEY